MLQTGMKGRWVLRTLAAGALLWLVWRCWKLVGDDPILQLILFLFAGAGGGLFFVKVVLPRLADAIGTSIFLSGERLPSEEQADKEETGGDEAENTGVTEQAPSEPQNDK
ncbi:MAG: hypothetical protein CJBNEKGG_03770 [Prosthecobacter sp.]|nr:hypothetical protein [Prosthecobacter sp.]